jgi:phage gp45-like
MGPIERALLPIKRKLSLIIGRAILTAIDNSDSTVQKIKVTVLNDEVATDVERLQNYGFESYPTAASTEALIVYPGGYRNQGIAVVVHDRTKRPTDLSSGDVVMYDTRDNRVSLKSSGIEIEAKDGDDIEKSVLGETLKDKLDELIDAILKITVPTVFGPSGTPINAATFSNIKSQLSDILSDYVKNN